MRRPIIAGNWKMYKTPDEAVELITGLKKAVNNTEAEVVVCPPFVDLPGVLNAVGQSGIKVGAQNMHWEAEGAYTGEISPRMLAAIGCSYVIIGHSERRQFFSETDEHVNKKVKAAFHHGLTPIVCVGETLEQREAGATFSLVENQVRKGLENIAPKDAEKLVLAYEPIWAIGTGRTASGEDAEKVIAHMRQLFGDMFGKGTAEKIRIQYGGSVKPDNIKELMEKPNIDGALVGGASLVADSFSKIVSFR